MSRSGRACSKREAPRSGSRGVNRLFIVTAIAASLSSCGRDEASVLSARYGVCAKLGNATYSVLEPGPDYDVGEIRESGRRIEVLMGGHPGFPTSTLVRGLSAVDGFKVIGESRDRDSDEILFAFATGAPQGPTYVRLSSRDVGGDWGPIKNGFLVSCNQQG